MTGHFLKLFVFLFLIQGLGTAAVAADKMASNKTAEAEDSDAPVASESKSAPTPDCSEAVTTREVNACIHKQVRRSETIMADYLLASHEMLAAEAGASRKLDVAQQDWQAYRESQCAAIFEYWKGGTIRTTMQLSCLKEMNMARARFLWQAYLQPMDGGDGPLPEPALY